MVNTWRWYGYENAWTVIDGIKMKSVTGGGHSGAGIFISTEDMARFGLLFLNSGKWNSEQLLSESWIQEATTPSVPNPNYGYMWWLIENTNDHRLKNAYSAQGALGQNITVYPKIDVVLAFKTKSTYRRRNSIQTQMNVIKN